MHFLIDTGVSETESPASPVTQRPLPAEAHPAPRPVPQRVDEGAGAIGAAPNFMMGEFGDAPAPQPADHEIEGPAKLLNYVIIALFFAIIAVVLRKISHI